MKYTIHTPCSPYSKKNVARNLCVSQQQLCNLRNEIETLKPWPYNFMILRSDFVNSASLLNCVPYKLTCQRALHAYVLKCLRALRTHVLTCQRALRAHVLTCQRILYVYVLICQHALRILCMPTCSRAITTNDKDKFSITCFLYIFVIALCLFPVK